jgi:hypothetical protein
LDFAGVTVGFFIVSLYLGNWFEPEEAAEEQGGPSRSGEKGTLDCEERSESRKGLRQWVRIIAVIMEGGGLYRSMSARGIRRSRLNYQHFASLLIQPHLRGWLESL